MKISCLIKLQQHQQQQQYNLKETKTRGRIFCPQERKREIRIIMRLIFIMDMRTADVVTVR